MLSDSLVESSNLPLSHGAGQSIEGNLHVYIVSTPHETLETQVIEFLWKGSLWEQLNRMHCSPMIKRSCVEHDRQRESSLVLLSTITCNGEIYMVEPTEDSAKGPDVSEGSVTRVTRIAH